ncbi:MAG: DUF1028 domain-containing protein [Pseudomonadota bacterium]
MTYTVLGRCERTDRLGIGIATYSLAVGGYCPWGDGRLGVVSTQANVNPALGPAALEAMAKHSRADDILGAIRSADTAFNFRQVAIVLRDGGVAAHTGSDTRAWKGHLCGAGFVVMGNVLAGESVVTAMRDYWCGHPSSTLEARLLGCLKAGRAAGGQTNAVGEPLAERSAALRVYAGAPYPQIDLRVDSDADAISRLDALYVEYEPYVDYYALRHRDPGSAPPQDAWVRTMQTDA